MSKLEIEYTCGETDIELKNCPFCECESAKIKRMELSEICFCVHCEECETHGPLSSNELIAINAWNKRPNEDKLIKSLRLIMGTQGVKYG